MISLSSIKSLIKIFPYRLSERLGACTMSKLHTFNWDKPEEITIQLPQGVIAGKWWGPKHIRPILCVHGWQDNAGSFDTLIPLLPKHVSYLAIDLPGHGYSFRYPSGIVYNFTDLVYLIKLIVDMYKWKKVSLLTHSMSIMASFFYAGLLPKDVDFFISIDLLKPPYLKKNRLQLNISKGLENYLKLEKQCISDSQPPAYSYEETVERLIKGSQGSIKKEAAPYLLKRGAAPSKLDPTKYYFTYDNRVKTAVLKMVHNDFVMEMLQNLRVNYLLIKANSKTPFYLDSIKSHDEALEILKKSNPNFVFRTVEGTHHVHLNEPEKLSGFISDFICRLRPVNSELEDINKNDSINCKL